VSGWLWLVAFAPLIGMALFVVVAGLIMEGERSPASRRGSA